MLANIVSPSEMYSNSITGKSSNMRIIFSGSWRAFCTIPDILVPLIAVEKQNNNINLFLTDKKRFDITKKGLNLN